MKSVVDKILDGADIRRSIQEGTADSLVREINDAVAPWFKTYGWEDVEFSNDAQLNLSAVGYDPKDENGEKVLYLNSPKDFGAEGIEWLQRAEAAEKKVLSILKSAGYEGLQSEVTDTQWPDFAVIITHPGGRKEGSPGEDRALL